MREHDEIVDAMAISLAQSTCDLADEREVALLLLSAGYDEREIADHRRQAVRLAAASRRTDSICAGLSGGAYG
ncbi:hypothetical protein NVS89_22690 [Ancylobacter sp. MQZ15Z-1]|uniref:Uncharacterized protein n=1 Tax=Ancylobacter mangrovi TaxID=2972472 RepID=A0A9X2T965_9HYPH|nr:hypothetical protein [Ancylobacter mangrovi]MCS0497903.1 hypothetical protein [Ancylobacter mangrovi]